MLKAGENTANFKTESKLQSAIVNYIKWQYPDIRYCASLGGQYQKFISQRIKGRSTGYVPGMPDLQIMEAKGGYFGLFIELKLNNKRYASPLQKEWIKDLQNRGYKAIICKGFDETINIIDEYLKKEKTQSHEKE